MPRKPKLTDICREIIAIVDGTDKDRRTLLRKYHLLENDDGSTLLLFEQENEMVKFCSDRALIRDVREYCNVVRKPRYPTVPHTQKIIASDIQNGMRILPERPALLRFIDEPGLCFHRIPFRPGDEEKCPLFLEMMHNTTNAEALKSFIGSLFMAASDRSQYVWIWGEGMNGKGALLRMLQRILNGCFASETTPTPGNRFWTAGLLAKRLVAFPDCDNPEFPSSGFFKMLTGGDYVRIERKGQEPFSSQLDAKFIFMSNRQPILEANKADMRRAIFCEMGPIKEYIDRFEDKLWDEAPHIVAHCIIKYAETVHNGIIMVDNKSFDEVTTVTADTMQSIFEQHFSYCYDPKAAAKYQPYVTGPEMQTILANGASLKKKAERSAFLAFLGTKYNVRNQTFRVAGEKVIRGYLGVKAKWYDLDRRRESSNDIIPLNPNQAVE